MTHETCPHCGTDQRGQPIPGDPQGRRYSRTLGVEIRGVYDGVLYWQCPDCGGTWHRWPEGDPLRHAASCWVPDNPTGGNR
jgi:hypothetical protein